MSLVNEMLQDLQDRRATDSRPLAGLHAVPDSDPGDEPMVRPLWRFVVGFLIVLFFAAVWVRTDSAAKTTPLLVRPASQIASPILATVPVATTSPTVADAEPMVPAATRFRSLTMDTVLTAVARSTMPRKRATVRQQAVQPVVAAKTKKAANRKAAVAAAETAPDDAVATVTRVAITLAARLRQDGLAALQAGRLIEAERHLRQLVAVDAGSSEPHLLLHAALRAQNRSGAARSALLVAVEQASEPIAIVRVLGHELLVDGRIAQAVVLLEQHRPAGHSDLEYEAMLAAAYQRAGNHGMAMDIYQELVARQPANGAWWVGQAISQEATGRVDDARESFAAATLAGTLDTTLARYVDERLKKLETGS